MSMVVKTPATSTISLQGYTILIIEDNPNNLGVIVDYLEETGLKVVVARNGEMGLKRAQFAQPDIILLDVMMPGIDGFETCRRLKSDAKTQEIPVIFMTALDDPEDKLKGFGVGGVDYITKPIQHEEVLARVTTHLRIHALTLKLNAKIEELIQTRNELVQNEKMASLGRLVAGFAHEINTPIGVAVGAASTLEENANAIDKQLEQEEVNEEELLENLETVKEAARLTLSNLKRASNLITSFKRTAIDQSSNQVRRFEVKATIDDIINTLHNQFKRTAIDIQVDCPRDLVINSMPGTLEQILTNLLINSLIHGFDEGKNTGSINIKAQIEDNHLHLEYSDTGKGIAPENVEKIFEPFFTTHRAQGGSGLGMYICYNLIVTQLNGTIICESIPGKGIVFKINYPIDLKN